MATIKEFPNKRTGVRVYIRVNHRNKLLKSRMIDYWANGYNGESVGHRMLAWMEIKPDAPVKIPGLGLSISSQFKDQEPTMITGRKTPDYSNHFTVTITKGNLSESFDYHASINDADAGIVNLSNNDKIGAFYCFIQDAISGMMQFKEFKSDLGFDDCCEAHRIWKLCQESTIKATRLGLGDLYKLSEFLMEKYPDVV
jgi:hypothetical protein